MMSTDEIHQKLLSNLHYDSETGVFTRNGKRAGGVGAKGYRRIYFNGKSYQEHVLAWFYVHKEWPSVYTNEIDHINRDRADNRLSNLRLVNRAKNNYNCGMSKNNTSGYVGVAYQAQNNNWRAYVTKDYKQIHIGSYDTAEEAAEARALYTKQHNLI